MPTLQNNPHIEPIKFDPVTYQLVQSKARAAGMEFSEYINQIISSAIKVNQDKISPKAEQELLQDLIEFLQAEQVNPKPGATSVKDHLKLLGVKV